MTALELNLGMFIRPLDLPESAWTGHIPFAGWIIGALKPKRFVELGTHNGASYLAFCQAVSEGEFATQCRAIDTWQGDKHAGFYQNDLFDALERAHHHRYGGFSKLLRMTFDEALGEFEDGSIDLLHIDGLHTYDAVRHDFETWLPKMSSRGVILFHDTAERESDFGVWKLWDDVASRYPAFEFKHSHGLGVLLVGSQLSEVVYRLTTLDEQQRQLTRRLFETLASECRLTPEFALEGVPAGQGEVGLVLAYLRQQLTFANAELVEVYKQLGRADAYAKTHVSQFDAYAKTQASNADALRGEIAERERRIERLKRKLADCQVELEKASEQLVTADQNARAHVAASALVQRDIQDLQRHIAEQAVALLASQAEAASARSELDKALQQLQSRP